MAEAVLFNISEGIIGKLGSLALQEIGLLCGVKDELQKLNDTVSTIQAVLLDAEEQFEKSHQVRIWLEKLKDAFYDADDLLDDFSTEALRRKVMSGSKMEKQKQEGLNGTEQSSVETTIILKLLAEKLDGFHQVLSECRLALQSLPSHRY